MPKKHNKYPSIKPVNPVHPSLISSSSNHHQHGGSGSSTGQERSVNDLIQHLRRTQVTDSAKGKASASPSRVITPRTVHPLIRNILELPETPPPRPRPNARPVLGRRVRRTPGPPPPSSWLEGSSSDSQRRRTEPEVVAAGSGRVLHRLERLPGIAFPPKRSLQHTILTSMALNWTWHMDYDGTFLSELPNRMKMLLLSYMAMCSRDLPVRTRMHGLHPLFTRPSDNEAVATEPEITRLDLSGAIGRWISLRQLSNELVLSRQHEPSGEHKPEEVIPSSWDAESDSESTPALPPLLNSPTQTLRFENLRFLSLAHPDPASASWSSLLNLLSRISTLTHLSLAHWPVPTLTPNSINARIQHPTHRSLSFAYGGTDTFSAFEDNWAEASGVLRKLSRATYCLKWLDLEGCGQWFGALSWNGVGPDGEIYSSPGPEWNGSWRDIEWVGLGPGWLPEKPYTLNSDDPARSLEEEDNAFVPERPSRPLTASIHTPSASDGPGDDGALPWDVEVERAKYRQAQEMKAYENILRKAREVAKHVHRIRKEGGGKWLHFSFGGDGEEERDVLDRAMRRIDRTAM
jgi:hypothetical protein